MKDRIGGLALLLAAAAAGLSATASCAPAPASGAAGDGGTMAEAANPIAALDPGRIESVSLQRFTYAGLIEQNPNGIDTVHSGGQTGSYPRGNPCALTGADAAAVIAALALAEPRPSDRERRLLDTQIRIGAGDGREIVAILPPRTRPERHGGFVVSIGVGTDWHSYRLDGDSLATIERIAAACSS